MVSLVPLLVGFSLFTFVMSLDVFSAYGALWAAMLLLWVGVSWFVEECGLGVVEGCVGIAFMLLFILGEVIFIFSVMLSSVYVLSGEGVFSWCASFDFSLILSMSAVLLSSGVLVVVVHMLLLLNSKWRMWMGVVAFMGLYFMSSQMSEWVEMSLGFVSGGPSGYMFLITGFHGLHVGVGALALLGCSLSRLMLNGGLTSVEKVEIAIWYWHFVDVVWLFVLLFCYW